MATVKSIISSADKACDGFEKVVASVETKMFREAITLMQSLEFDAQGNIKTTMENLKKLSSIKAKLNKVAEDPVYKAAVKEFVKAFATIQKEQNAYFSQEFPGKTLGENAKKRHEAMKVIAVENTIEGLSTAGVKANVTDKLNDMLLKAVTTGMSFADLQEEVRKYLVGQDGGTGALTRYATTYSVTSLSQFTGQNNKLLTDNLGVEWFMYVGSTMERTREFCQHMTAKKWVHVSEIPEILKGHIEYDGEVHKCKIYAKTKLPSGMIEGTNEDNFQVNVGGWNCRHQLVPVAAAAVPEELRKKFESPDKVTNENEQQVIQSVDLDLYKDRIQRVYDYVNTHKSEKVRGFLDGALTAASVGNKSELERLLTLAEKTIEINEASIRSKAKKREEAKNGFIKWHKDHGAELNAMMADINRCDTASYMEIINQEGHKYDEYEAAFASVKDIISETKRVHALAYSWLKREIDNARKLGYDDLAQTAESHLSTFESYFTNDERRIRTDEMNDTAASLRAEVQERERVAEELRKELEEALKKVEKLRGIVNDSEIEDLKKSKDINELSARMDSFKAISDKISSFSNVDDQFDAVRRFGLQEVEEANKVIQKVFDRWNWEFDTEKSLNFLKGRLEREIGNVMSVTGQSHKTWPLANAAFQKRLDLVNKRIEMLSVKNGIESQIAFLSGTKSSVAKTLLAEFDAMFADNETPLELLRAKAQDIQARAKAIDAQHKRAEKKAQAPDTKSVVANTQAGNFVPKSDEETKEDFVAYMKSLGYNISKNDVVVDKGFIHFQGRMHEYWYDGVKPENVQEHHQLWNHRAPSRWGAAGYVHTGNSFKINGDFRATGVTGPITKDAEMKLRAHGAMDDDIKTVKLLDKKISEYKTSTPMIVTRYVEWKALNSIFPGANVVNSRLSHLLTQCKKFVGANANADPAYMSASTNEWQNVFYDNDVKLQIEVPPGTPVYITNNIAESEVVFGRGTKLHVVDMSLTKDNHPQWKVDYEHLTVRCRLIYP